MNGSDDESLNSEPRDIPAPDPPPPAPAQAAPIAWQPFTFRGVAAFAEAGPGRLLLVALLMSLLAGVSVARCLYVGWVPTLHNAVARLPDTGEIRDGRLFWPADSPALVAENAFLAIVVNPNANAKAGQSADLQIELGPSKLAIASLFGYVAFDYPRNWIIALNRPEIEPLWGAWRPYLMAATAALVALALLAVWTVLAAVFAAPTRVYAFLLDRAVTLGGCWRLCVAGLQPGGLLMTMAILLYGWQRLTLAELLLINALHAVVGLVYFCLAPLRLPRVRSPFAAPPTPSATGLNGPTPASDTVPTPEH